MLASGMEGGGWVGLEGKWLVFFRFLRERHTHVGRARRRGSSFLFFRVSRIARVRATREEIISLAELKSARRCRFHSSFSISNCNWLDEVRWYLLSVCISREVVRPMMRVHSVPALRPGLLVLSIEGAVLMVSPLGVSPFRRQAFKKVR